MKFYVSCIDRPNASALRQKLRVSHLQYMIAAKDEIAFGGPVKTDEMNQTLGSMFVIEKPNREEVEAFLENEPYFKNGLFETVQIHAINVMVPERKPGFLNAELERELKMELSAEGEP